MEPKIINRQVVRKMDNQLNINHQIKPDFLIDNEKIPKKNWTPNRHSETEEYHRQRKKFVIGTNITLDEFYTKEHTFFIIFVVTSTLFISTVSKALESAKSRAGLALSPPVPMRGRSESGGVHAASPPQPHTEMAQLLLQY